ncbi:MAG: discoidin domain-containing protein [Prevotellaceae bacterium]|jgi:hypothetical protein|nr:discoidin domain-containing protein [Prevotellaceae bacterium]
MKTKKTLFMMVSGLILSGCVSAPTGEYSRGIGVYPGDSKESYAPLLVEDNTTYRNVAERKAAYHSSAYDYNLTAQLVTDGIVTSEKPSYINVSTQDGPLAKREREWLFDQKTDSKYIVKGNNVFLQLDLHNMNISVDRILLRGNVQIDPTKPAGYEMLAYASNDGELWTLLDSRKLSGQPGEDLRGMRGFRMPRGGANTEAKPNPSPVIFNYDYVPAETEDASQAMFFGGGGRASRPVSYEVKLEQKESYKHYKFEFKTHSAIDWFFTDWEFYDGEEFQVMLPSMHFKSAWRSASAEAEWVYVDLGAPATFDKINLFWINKAAKGAIEVSDDAKTWKQVAALPGGSTNEDVIELAKAEKGRYVRLALSESADGQPYVLSEMQVYGKGGLVPRKQRELAVSENKQALSGGNWVLQRASVVSGVRGEEIATEGFDVSTWIPATVPGTVLSSFMNLGAVPDPNYADDQTQVSESYFLSDFWYRNEFTVNNPADFMFLHFDGINWKANVFLNGARVGDIAGAFMRGNFDVSKYIKKGKNILAVQIVKNAHPGAIKEQNAWSTDQNGGIPGADNPTFHATIGWDWIPTIRGRDIGIWNDVYLTYNGAVTIEDPFVRTELPLPDTTSANVFVEVTLKNHAATAVNGTLKGAFGEAAFDTQVTLQANETKVVKLDAISHPVLHLENPKLWWPKGYGAPNLYNVTFSFETNGKVTDKTAFLSGVRQMTFDENIYLPSGGMSFGTFGQSEARRLSMYINGRRFVGFGGNWGFGESNLNYRAREYDIAVAYHADMNFTIIRNWVGQIGDEEFYEACDRHGVMVWQDFWLANPVDGPNPYYVDMFNANAKDYVRRIRNHPSIAIYVGRNEGDPPAEIDNYLHALIPAEHPGLYYISNSAMGVVSGGGPYRAYNPKYYFQSYGHDKFHSERGMPNVMNYENMLRAFGAEHIEPVNTEATPNDIYGLHDYTLGAPNMSSAQATSSFNEIMETMFGKPEDAKQFAEWAQWINYEGYRAIFEGRSEHRRGMLLWMSHPAWPSMVWQTYDYYFDPTGAYFGCKKASESLHIQWNRIRDDVEVVNYHALDKTGLTAKAQIYNQNGTLAWEKEAPLSIKEDQTVACFPLEFGQNLSSTHFIKLTLSENGKVVSENFYWRGNEDGNYKSLLQLPQVKLTTNTSVTKVGDEWQLTTTVKNETNTPALMIRLKAIGNETGEMILPAFYDDNYFFLLPGEAKTVTIRLQNFDTRGETPEIAVSGFNIQV